MHDAQQMSGIIVAILGFYLVFFLVIMTAVVVPTWFICKKAGFSPWLSFIVIVPFFGGLVLLYVLAFAEWKVVPAPQIGWTPQPPHPPLPPQV